MYIVITAYLLLEKFLDFSLLQANRFQKKLFKEAVTLKQFCISVSYNWFFSFVTSLIVIIKHLLPIGIKISSFACKHQ